MAFDEGLVHRVQEHLADRADLGPADVEDKRMFGGLGLMVRGNMACGILEDQLIVRLGEEGADAALKEDGVRPFDFTGRPMKGWVYVGPEALSGDEELARWVDAGVDFALSLDEGA